MDREYFYGLSPEQRFQICTAYNISLIASSQSTQLSVLLNSEYSRRAQRQLIEEYIARARLNFNIVHMILTNVNINHPSMLEWIDKVELILNRIPETID